MTRIAILTNVVLPGDAVSNDVLGMRDALSAEGHEVQVFATGAAVEAGIAKAAPDAIGYLRDPNDCLIYHFAFGWEPGLDLLRNVRCKRVVKYHNVTPPEFFEGYSQEYVDGCRRGREHVALVAQAGCDLYLSDSDYNAGELIAAGAVPARSFVVPPFHHIDRLESVAADQAVLRRYGQDGLTNLVNVGRIVPNKRHELLLESFARYRSQYDPSARLLIVGREDDRLAAYGRRLRRWARLLGLGDSAVFTGGVTDEQLKAIYSVAAAFVLTSEHEGFSVPLVEAMAARVPIVAVAAGAVAGTVGDAGIVWGERDPALIAAGVDAVVRNKDLRNGLSVLGQKRYRERFSNQQIRTRLLGALGPLFR